MILVVVFPYILLCLRLKVLINDADPITLDHAHISPWPQRLNVDIKSLSFPPFPRSLHFGDGDSFYFGAARSKEFATHRKVPKLLFWGRDWTYKVSTFWLCSAI